MIAATDDTNCDRELNCDIIEINLHCHSKIETLELTLHDQS